MERQQPLYTFSEQQTQVLAAREKEVTLILYL
jgi:hypothetical protein